MKTLRILLFVPLLMAFQCEDDLNIEEDLLFESGIYGGWELSSQTINGISDMMPLPEVILEFYADNNTLDNRGEYNLEEPSVNTVGVFIMDQLEQSITLQKEGGADIIYGYIINPSKDRIRFSFTENNTQVEQGWQKIY